MWIILILTPVLPKENWSLLDIVLSISGKKTMVQVHDQYCDLGGWEGWRPNCYIPCAIWFGGSTVSSEVPSTWLWRRNTKVHRFVKVSKYWSCLIQTFTDLVVFLYHYSSFFICMSAPKILQLSMQPCVLLHCNLGTTNLY